MRAVGLLNGCFCLHATQAHNAHFVVIWEVYGFHASDTKLEAHGSTRTLKGILLEVVHFL
ncbi:hypothetical protein PO909_033670 [Leuciscus waleckii]